MGLSDRKQVKPIKDIVSLAFVAFMWLIFYQPSWEFQRTPASLQINYIFYKFFKMCKLVKQNQECQNCLLVIHPRTIIHLDL